MHLEDQLGTIDCEGNGRHVAASSYCTKVKQRYPGFDGNPILIIYTCHLIQMCKVPFGISSGSTKDSLVPNCPFVAHTVVNSQVSLLVSLCDAVLHPNHRIFMQRFSVTSSSLVKFRHKNILHQVQQMTAMNANYILLGESRACTTLHSTLTTPVILFLLWKGCLTHLLMQMTFCCRYIKLFCVSV